MGSPNSSPRSNLQLRVMSGVILGALVLVLTWLGGLPFRLMAAAMAGAVFHEWYSMHKTVLSGSHAWAAAGALAASMILMLVGQPIAVLFPVLAGAFAVLAVHGWLTGAGAVGAGGFAYAAAPTVALVLLRADDQPGLVAILFLFSVVWTTDIMAYFTGRALGGAKLAPSISPGKTWSGAMGGTVFAVLAGVAFVWHDSAVPGVTLMAVLSFVLAVVSQLGDLFESALKRRRGVKDSGSLIPGHGGVMDRVDGLLAAAAVLYLLSALLGWPEMPAHALFR
ncbi:phosphatidate cytidylyltransferase [Nitratireductor sp. GISD-1A_MAKvit]|uniref:phosphatidate cytidylyltransferase n=1 Tax=Nitratireductor sp. GISD-1A_MAKvit TaxID=3234198 RepID=UPI003467C890